LRQDRFTEGFANSCNQSLPYGVIGKALLASDSAGNYFDAVRAVAKKALIGIVGGIVLLVGVAMIVLPGPAIVVIPAGLAILATEFEWAHRLKERAKDWFERARERHRARKSAKTL
jgi:hypothetical protein